MATMGTYTLQAFIDDLERITSEETAPERITERAAPLLGRLVQDPSTIPPQYLRSTPQSRGRYMLHRAPRFNITAVVWRPGDTAGAHNHETWGVIGVIDNEIEETRYRVTETGGGRARLEVTRVMRHLDRGSLTPAVAARLSALRISLEVNQRIVKMHLEAVREVSTILADAIQEAESDGTYSVSVGRPAQRP